MIAALWPTTPHPDISSMSTSYSSSCVMHLLPDHSYLGYSLQSECGGNWGLGELHNELIWTVEICDASPANLERTLLGFVGHLNAH